MFNAEYFKDLVNETSDMIRNRDKYTEIEDIDEKIESNKLALSILSDDIKDEKLRENIKSKLNNLYENIDISVEEEKVDMEIEEEIYKYSRILRNKAERLYDGVLYDKEVLDSVSKKMTKNITGTGENIRKINRGRRNISAFSLFLFCMTIFLIVYPIIRFL